MCLRFVLLMGFLFSASMPTLAQIVTFQTSLKDSTLDILYVGCPNKVLMKNLPVGTRVKFENKLIIPSGSVYILNPKHPDSATVYVYDQNNNIVFRKHFVCRSIHDVRGRLGEVEYQIASISEVLVNPSITIFSSDSLLKPFVRIKQYELTLIANNHAETIKVSANDLIGAPFSQDIQHNIALMKIGDRILIENIKVSFFDEAERLLPPITVTIAIADKLAKQSNSGNSSLRDEVRLIVDGMLANGTDRIERGVGWIERLQDKATSNELILLTDHDSPIVKNHAFIALSSRKNIDLVPVVIRHIRDTSRVDFLSGCIVTSSRTNANFLMKFYYGKERTNNESALPSAQQKMLDSILLFDSTFQFSMKNTILKSIQPDLKYYDKIREMATSGGQPVFSLLLAKYKKSKDIDIIKRLFLNDEYYGICAVREFPDPSFYTSLTALFVKEYAALESDANLFDQTWGVLLEALAQYPNLETLQLFEKIAAMADKTQNQNLGKDLLVAIHKYPNNIFEPLKETIWLDVSNQKLMKEEIEKETW